MMRHDGRDSFGVLLRQGRLLAGVLRTLHAQQRHCRKAPWTGLSLSGERAAGGGGRAIPSDGAQWRGDRRRLTRHR